MGWEQFVWNMNSFFASFLQALIWQCQIIFVVLRTCKKTGEQKNGNKSLKWKRLFLQFQIECNDMDKRSYRISRTVISNYIAIWHMQTKAAWHVAVSSFITASEINIAHCTFVTAGSISIEIASSNRNNGVVMVVLLDSVPQLICTLLFYFIFYGIQCVLFYSSYLCFH